MWRRKRREGEIDIGEGYRWPRLPGVWGRQTGHFDGDEGGSEERKIVYFSEISTSDL